MIRNAKIGEIVYLEQGHGPKCKIVEVVPFARFTLYHVKILEPRTHAFLTNKDWVARRAGEFSRMKKCISVTRGFNFKAPSIRCPNVVEGEGDFCEVHRSEDSDGK